MRNKCLFSIPLLFMALTLPASAVVASPEDLDAVRHDALQIIQSGQRLDAARLLLETLSALPKDRADLAVPAIGAVQLLMFTNEYLMTDEERQALYANSLDEKNNEMHRFLATLMRYLDDSGISQEESDKCALDLFGLTQSDNLPVRIGALFIMSDPYYFYDTPLAHQARDQIAREFPGSYLAREAQRLPLYSARTGGTKALKEVLERTNEDGTLRADSARTRADRIGAAIYASIKEIAPGTGDSACAAALVSAAREAQDWTEEYAALNILEGFHAAALQDQVKTAATEAIDRDRDPRCTFRARVIRMSVAEAQDDAQSVLADANALLALSDIPVVPDRNNYEELRNSIWQCSDYLVKKNLRAEAQGLLEKLKARFPDTALSEKLAQKIAAMSSPARVQEGN